jgi:Fanconi-associated nuclease 1
VKLFRFVSSAYFWRRTNLDGSKCIPTKVLSVICRLLCEDYGTRTSGLPDLFVWNFKDGHAKFVEVKGPGDSLMENQKVCPMIFSLIVRRLDISNLPVSEDVDECLGHGRDGR